MDSTNKYIAILDIGTTKIAAVIAQVIPQNDKPAINVLNYGIEQAKGMKRGMIIDIGEVTESIKKAAEKAKFFEDFDITEVYVGVSGYPIKSKTISHYKTIPHGVIDQKDLEVLISEVTQIAVNNNEQVLHIIPSKYIIDREFEHKNPISIEGKRLDGEFLVITAERGFIKSIKQVVKYAGLSTKKIIFNPIASAEAVLTEEEKEGGVALIDIGGGTTDLLVIHDKKILHTEVIPFAGENITIDIQKTLQILKSKAEELKTKQCNALALKSLDSNIIEIRGIQGRTSRLVTARALAIIAQSRLSEILDTIDVKVKKFIENGQMAAGFTVVGGTALLSNIKTFIKYRINHDVRIANPQLTDIEELNKPQFASTQGLILLANKYEQTPYQNLNTETIKKKKGNKTSKLLSSFIEKFNNLFSDGPDDF